MLSTLVQARLREKSGKGGAENGIDSVLRNIPSHPQPTDKHMETSRLLEFMDGITHVSGSFFSDHHLELIPLFRVGTIASLF